jgi:hypothetical protein
MECAFIILLEGALEDLRQVVCFSHSLPTWVISQKIQVIEKALKTLEYIPTHLVEGQEDIYPEAYKLVENCGNNIYKWVEDIKHEQ